MRPEYDFSRTRRNPCARRLTRAITIRLDEPTVRYFQDLAREGEIPYQTLITLYLRDCAAHRRKLSMRGRRPVA